MQHARAVRPGRLLWFVASTAGALSGCFYLDPINRIPKILPIERVCEDAAAPCGLDSLHPGDAVALTAAVDDRDGDERKTTLHWRITACDRTLTVCDPRRLVDADGPVASFVVPQTLGDAGGPVARIEVDLDAFDERGGFSSASDSLDVVQDPAPRDRTGAVR